MTKACRAIVYKSGSQAVDLDGSTGVDHQVTGTDDAVIQDAFTNILDAGRTQKEAVCLIGSFTLTATVTIPSFSILDNSQGFVRLTTNTSPNPAFSSTNTNNIQVQGGIFDGVTGTDVSGIEPESMIFLQQVINFKVTGVTCQKVSGECIWLQGDSYGQVSNNVITDGKVAGAVALPTLSSDHVSVTENNFYTWDTTITVYNATQVIISDNNLAAFSTSVGGGPCVEITTQSNTGTIKDVNVHDNTCSSSHSKGLWIHHGSGSGPISNVYVERNSFRGISCTPCTAIIEIAFIAASTSNINQLHIDGNTIVGSGNNFGSGSPCIYLSNNSVSASLVNSTFNDNVINGCTGEGIRFAGNLSNSTVIGNRIEGVVGAGIHLINFPVAGKCVGNVVTNNIVDSATTYGIFVDSGCNFNLVETNNVQNNPSGGVNNAGSNNLVRYNLGYKTENQGSQGSVIDTASTGVKQSIISHGLACTPNNIQVILQSPSDTTARFSGVWTSSVGATTFTANVAVTTAGVGGSTASLWWMVTCW